MFLWFWPGFGTFGKKINVIPTARVFMDHNGVPTRAFGETSRPLPADLRAIASGKRISYRREGSANWFKTSNTAEALYTTYHIQARPLGSTIVVNPMGTNHFTVCSNFVCLGFAMFLMQHIVFTWVLKGFWWNSLVALRCWKLVYEKWCISKRFERPWSLK